MSVGRKIGILHPGAMGSSIGACLIAAGHEVLWVAQDRSSITAHRARQDGLVEVETLAELAACADVIICVCPPDAALDLARSLSACGFAGIYVDVNAIAPATARTIHTQVCPGADFVDGGIIGPPARDTGLTRLYLSGELATGIRDLFVGSVLDVRCIDGGVGAASALKMAYAAWTKGSAALLLAIGGMAYREGVDDVLFAEWQLSQLELVQRIHSAARDNSPKAWRFAGEMREIAATFEANGLPDGFHLAAARIYQRMSVFKDLPEVDLAAVLSRLAAEE